MSSAQCDFCSAPEVKWAYPCRDFRSPVSVPGLPDQGSVGGWGACSVCYSLIERGDRAGLAKRSAKRLAKKHGLPLKLALRAVRDMHDQFFTHREGKPVPVERDGEDPTRDMIAPVHQLGPDVGTLARALSIPSASVRAIYQGDDGREAVYFERGGTVYRAYVRLEGERTYMRISEDQSLGASWDNVRLAIEAGLA